MKHGIISGVHKEIVGSCPRKVKAMWQKHFLKILDFFQNQFRDEIMFFDNHFFSYVFLPFSSFPFPSSFLRSPGTSSRPRGSALGTPCGPSG